VLLAELFNVFFCFSSFLVFTVSLQTTGLSVH
jgi:hypothetical protein